MGYGTALPRLFQNASWFVKLRWIVVIIAIASINIGQKLFDVTLQFNRLYYLVILLLIINIGYYIIIKIKSKPGKKFNILHLRLFLNIQVAIDFVILTIIVHYSGGIENPIIVFYIFHMILSSILLPKLDSIIQSTIALILFTGLIIFEYHQIIPHYTINEHLSNLFNSDIKYLSSALGIFIATSYVVVYLTSYVTRQLREHDKELELLNEELKEKDRIKNEYVLRLTHDIKGFVTSLKSNQEVINRRVYGKINENYDPFIKGTTHVLSNLSTFIKDLLKLTKSKLTGDFKKQQVEIDELIKYVKEEINDLLDKKNISFEVKIEPGQGNLYIFLISAKEMLVNIIDNAIKYSPVNSKVILEIKRYNKKYALFKITDKGIGIPKNEISKLFTEFYRATNVKKLYEGTGLGLSIVKQIAINHGGKVWAESKPDKGTNIYVTLPYS